MDVPFTTRFWYEHPGLDRPQGTILDVTFAPPTFTMRRLRTFDPRSGTWTLLDLEERPQPLRLDVGRTTHPPCRE